MTETAMYLIMGLLGGTLLGVAFVPLVHGRAVRLTTRRLEMALPRQASEVLAEKDLLRADFAMATRRLELAIEKHRNKNASQLIELGKKNDVINQLKLELNTLKMAAAKVVTTYAPRRQQTQPAVRQAVAGYTRGRDADVTRLLTALARRRSSDRRARAIEPTRRAV